MNNLFNVKEKIMGAKLSEEMKKAIKYFRKNGHVPDAAKLGGVSPTGLRYALKRENKSQKEVDTSK